MNTDNMALHLMGRGEPAAQDLCTEQTPASLTMFTPIIAQRLAEQFQLLADPTRMQLLSILSFEKGQTVCACQLAAALGLTPATISHHMKRLVKGGLVEVQRNGRWANYSIIPDGFNRLRTILNTDNTPPEGYVVEVSTTQ